VNAQAGDPERLVAAEHHGRQMVAASRVLAAAVEKPHGIADSDVVVCAVAMAPAVMNPGVEDGVFASVTDAADDLGSGVRFDVEQHQYTSLIMAVSRKMVAPAKSSRGE